MLLSGTIGARTAIYSTRPVGCAARERVNDLTLPSGRGFPVKRLFLSTYDLSQMPCVGLGAYKWYAVATRKP